MHVANYSHTIVYLNCALNNIHISHPHITLRKKVGCNVTCMAMTMITQEYMSY